MNIQEISEQNKILEIVTGSYLYGTNTESSDKDLVGIFMPSIEYILGFKRCEEVDLSIKDKTIENKNTKLAVDRKLYEFRKFIQLALDNNPNILEILFCNRENILFENDIGRKLLDIKHLFPHKGLKQKFLGYAFSQKHKMVIKKDNYFEFKSYQSYIITKYKNNLSKSLIELIYEENYPYFIKKVLDKNGNMCFISVGDINFMPQTTLYRSLNMVEDRLSKVGNREELVLKYGYDCKFGSHLIRLMLEGIELLTTGNLEFPLKEANLIKDIKQGNWKLEDILDYSNELELKIEDLYKDSKLPERPNYDEIERFTIDILKQTI